MNHEQASHLAKRIKSCWNYGPSFEDWREILNQPDVDDGKAGTAFARLRMELEHAPSIARFMSTYRSLDTDRPISAPACHECDNTGWVQAEDRIEHPGTDHERRYTQNRPCRCAEGKQRERSGVWRERNGEKIRKDHAA